nr:hypothetical protein [Tanacetum cinerariifolium]
MAQHKYETPIKGRISNLEETLNNFIKESRIRQKESENIVWGIKKNHDLTSKMQASSIKKMEYHLGKITKIIQDREAESLPSSIETNLKGLAHAITTRSRLNYKPPKNPLENITNPKDKPATKETPTKNVEKEPNDFIKPTLFTANMSEAKTQLPKLKELQSHLEYALLHNNQEFPVIISFLLNAQEKASLLKVLTKHKAELAWKVSDIKGIILGHKISKSGIEVDKAKIDVIAKLPCPTNVKGVRSFLGHAGFYRRVEGSGDRNSPEYQGTTGSKGKKFVNALSFYRMETDGISERYIAPCFVNGLEAYDGEVNLEFEENLISNKFTVKRCLDYEVKKGKKLVKRDLIVFLKGELYFVKFIINPEKDDFEPGVILGRSFLRLDHSFKDDSKKTGKSSDDWDQLLDFYFDDVPRFGEELLLFVCKMGKSNQEAEKEALAIRISQKFALLEEERPVIKTLAYNDKYKKILDEIWRDKVELYGKIVKEEEDAVKRIKGEALKEKDDPSAFIFPIRLEGKVNKNALADTQTDINTMPYQIYETLRREEIKKIDRGITMINHTQTEAMRKLSDVLCQVGDVAEMLSIASILTSGGVQVVSIPPAVEVLTVSVPTDSGMVSTASPIFTTASVVTPYSRRK